VCRWLGAPFNKPKQEGEKDEEEDENAKYIDILPPWRLGYELDHFGEEVRPPLPASGCTQTTPALLNGAVHAKDQRCQFHQPNNHASQCSRFIQPCEADVSDRTYRREPRHARGDPHKSPTSHASIIRQDL